MILTSDGNAYPVLPLRDIVVFPHMIVPLFVGREKSVRALEDVMKDDKQILLVAQKNAAEDDPTTNDIYTVGTVSTVLQLLKLPDGTVKVLVEGGQRAKITRYLDNEDFFQAEARLIGEEESRLSGIGGAVAVRGQSVRAVHQTEQENSAGSPGFDQPDRRFQQARRHRGVASGAEDFRETGTARNRNHRRAAGARLFLHGIGDRRPAGGKENPQPGQTPDGEDPARVLPERTDEGHPEGIGRDRGRQGRVRRNRGKDRQDQAQQGSPRKGHGRAEKAQVDVADVGRGHRRPQLSRLDVVHSVEKTDPHKQEYSRSAEDSRRRSLRPEKGQGTDTRISGRPAADQEDQGAHPLPRRPAGRRQDLAGQVHRPGERGANSSACHWAGCATNPKFAATGAPTSAPCPARSSRA